jgi:hypothetical protein
MICAAASPQPSPASGRGGQNLPFPFRQLRLAAGRHREVGESKRRMARWTRVREHSTGRGGLVGERNFEIVFLRNERHANVLARRSLTPARGTPGGLFEQIRQAKGSRRQVWRANPTGGAVLVRSRARIAVDASSQPLAPTSARRDAIAKRCSVASSTRRSKAAWCVAVTPKPLNKFLAGNAAREDPTANRSRPEMAPQRLEKIESAPENGMVAEASKLQHLVYGRAADRALRRNSLGPPPTAQRPQFTNSRRRMADGKFSASQPLEIARNRKRIWAAPTAQWPRSTNSPREKAARKIVARKRRLTS